MLENSESESLLSLALTAITPGWEAGDWAHASPPPSLPALVAMGMPAWIGWRSAFRGG
jgi:hypothetical protein